jgi:hypothetical protein
MTGAVYKNLNKTGRCHMMGYINWDFSYENRLVFAWIYSVCGILLPSQKNAISRVQPLDWAWRSRH